MHCITKTELLNETERYRYSEKIAKTHDRCPGTDKKRNQI